MKHRLIKIANKIFSSFGYQISKKKTISKITNPNIINSIISVPENIPSTTRVLYSELSKDVVIGERSVLYKVVLQGNVRVGNNTTINGPGTEFHGVSSAIEIGNFCSIASHTVIQDHNHDVNCLTTYFIKYNVFQEDSRKNDMVSKGRVKIGNDVWVGTHAVILSGVTIGDGAVIAANSVVTKDVSPYAIVAGSPAKVLKYRFSDDVISELLKLKWWNWDLEKIKRNKELFYGDLSLEKLHNIK